MSFKIATRFRSAAECINRIPIDKLNVLLSRIINGLNTNKSKMFNEAEESQLKSMFSLNDDELNLVIDSLSYIFEQSAYAGIAPEPLYDTLLQAGFDESHGKIIGRLWAAEASNFITKLKNKTIGHTTLVDTSYHLNLITSDSRLNKQHEPTAIFEFALNQPSSNLDTEKLCVEFNHNELYSFFSQLERMQHQLDNLSGSV